MKAQIDVEKGVDGACDAIGKTFSMGKNYRYASKVVNILRNRDGQHISDEPRLLINFFPKS
ncbi:hypothetical protein [Chamaesiphon minutus]|uniref:hypothetical protein n=1 Tax=Chamaesiphon minutus TaxID=1173032 RepID=UPI0018DED487|nr:hypothetical protein [Chamaesiphon minutus]